MSAAHDHARRARGRRRHPRRSARDRRRVRRLSVELVLLAYIAGQQVSIPDEERNAAMRRALLVYAAGGDVHREPSLDEPAVLELARDLDTPERRQVLLAALGGLEGAEPLVADPDFAWRAYACGLIAEELGKD